MTALHIKIEVVLEYQIVLSIELSQLLIQNLSRKPSFFDHEGHKMENTVACKIALLWRSCSN